MFWREEREEEKEEYERGGRMGRGGKKRSALGRTWGVRGRGKGGEGGVERQRNKGGRDE